MSTRDQRATNLSYYWRNRSHEISRVRLRQGATRDLLRAMRSVPCADCGKQFEAHQMDFDHRDPTKKGFRLTAGGAMLMSRQRLEEEIVKCDIVCANCHRVRTRSRAEVRQDSATAGPLSRDLVRKRGYWQAQARWLAKLKQEPCTDCGGRFPACAMDFDHREPSSKRYTVSRMVGRTGTATIMAEVAKCDIVCADCHRDRTFRRRASGSIERE